MNFEFWNYSGFVFFFFQEAEKRCDIHHPILNVKMAYQITKKLEQSQKIVFFIDGFKI